MKLFATVLPASAVRVSVAVVTALSPSVCTPSVRIVFWLAIPVTMPPTHVSVMVVPLSAVSVCAAAVIAELAALVAAVVTAALPSVRPVSMPVVKLPPLVLASPFAFSSSPPPNQPVMVSQMPLPSFASPSIAPLMPLEIVLPTPPQSMPEIAVLAASKPADSHAPAVSSTVSTPPLMAVPTSFHGIPAT